MEFVVVASVAVAQIKDGMRAYVGYGCAGRRKEDWTARCDISLLVRCLKQTNTINQNFQENRNRSKKQNPKKTNNSVWFGLSGSGLKVPTPTLDRAEPRQPKGEGEPKHWRHGTVVETCQRRQGWPMGWQGSIVLSRQAATQASSKRGKSTIF